MTMKISTGFLLKGAAWTIGAYGVSLGLRLATNIVLARLLAPELFGIMLIVYTLQRGAELLTDVGIGQNIVYSKNAEDPEFYNTAWSLQLIRNVAIWLVCLAAAAPVAQFYRSPTLALIVPITTIGLLFGGLTSVSRILLQKRLQIAVLTLFELIVSFISSVAFVLFAFLSPTIWALVFGGLVNAAIQMIGSYFLLPGVKQKFYLSKQFLWEILHFGKWIFIAQLVYFLSTNFDRLYLAKVVPFELLGIYGIARSISELTGGLVLRLGNSVLFPFIASHSQTPRADLREQLTSIRLRFFLLAALGFSIFVATADLAIKLLYDQRYQAATWILPVLTIGSWFSIIANVNEATLLGLGKPSYSAVSSGSKFAFLLIGLPLGINAHGFFGGVLVIALADLCRYIPILVGQRRERFSFGMQDLLLTLAVFLLIGFLEWLRWILGFGTSFDSLPIDVGAFFSTSR
jgi:O-antigen/teichoic acid export membrane protein